MTPPEKYYELIDRLYQKTVSGELEWKETADSNTIQVSFPYHSILISESMYSNKNGIFYLLSIFNGEGKRVDSVSDPDLDTEHVQRLADLYRRARRQAISAEKAIDEILNALKDAR